MARCGPLRETGRALSSHLALKGSPRLSDQSPTGPFASFRSWIYLASEATVTWPSARPASSP